MSGAPLGTPSSPLLAALMAVTGGTPQLPANSRYQGLPTLTCTGAGGRLTVYLSRRIVPQASAFATLGMHKMGDGERLDQVATQLMGDPLLAWRLSDANNALDPAELEQRGLLIRVTFPAGIPASNA
jgi:hypothetical protein